jgi:hypothetical protein
VNKAKCAAAKGKWYDLDFSKNPYTCQMMPNTIDTKVFAQAQPVAQPSMAQPSMAQPSMAQPSMKKIAPALSQKVEDVPIFYKHCNMSGNSIKLKVGVEHILDDSTLKNNISSIYIPKKYFVSLIDSNNNVLKLDKSVNCLIDNKIENSTWNDRAVRVFIGTNMSVERFSNSNNINIILILLISIALIIGFYFLNKKK